MAVPSSFAGQRSGDPFADFLIGRWVWTILPLVFAAMVADEAYGTASARLVAYGTALLIGSLAGVVPRRPRRNAPRLAPDGVGAFNRSGSRRCSCPRRPVPSPVYAYWRTTQHALAPRPGVRGRPHPRPPAAARRAAAGAAGARRAAVPVRRAEPDRRAARARPAGRRRAARRPDRAAARDAAGRHRGDLDGRARVRARRARGCACSSTSARRSRSRSTASPLAARSGLGADARPAAAAGDAGRCRARATFAWRLSAEPFASDDAIAAHAAAAAFASHRRSRLPADRPATAPRRRRDRAAARAPRRALRQRGDARRR